MRFTKILATIWPKTQSLEQLRALTAAWMNAVRLNFSHSDHAFHGVTIANTRQLEQELGIHIPLILDTKWPEIRTWQIAWGGKITLNTGDSVKVTAQEVFCTNEEVSIQYPSLVADVSVWGTIMIADGLIQLRIDDKQSNTLVCTVLHGGELGERKNVNLPGVIVKLPALSAKDEDDLRYGCEQKVDYIAASFIRKASDVQEIRSFLDSHGGHQIKIIAKIENQEWIDNFDAILAEVDAIMVARGDLWTDIPLAHIPGVQKRMIYACNQAGKIVVTATQMLDSMIVNPRPTRAEVTDVANAVLDGTDVVMLSGETAQWAYPCESVAMMAGICEETEKNSTYATEQSLCLWDSGVACSVAYGAVHIATHLGASCIVASSCTGVTVSKVRQYTPSMPVLALTPNKTVARQVMLFRGVGSVLCPLLHTYEELYHVAQQTARDYWFARNGQYIVVTGWGSMSEIGGMTDMIKVIEL